MAEPVDPFADLLASAQAEAAQLGPFAAELGARLEAAETPWHALTPIVGLQVRVDRLSMLAAGLRGLLDMACEEWSERQA